MNTNDNVFLLGDIADFKNKLGGMAAYLNQSPNFNIINKKKFLRKETISVKAGRQAIIIPFNIHEGLGEIYFKDYSNIKEIQLEVGGISIDYIKDNNIIRSLQKLYNMKGIPFFIFKQIIPRLLFHNIRIHVELYKDDELSYDVHEYLNYNETLDKVIFQTQFSHNENIKNRLKLYFNNTVYILLVKTEPYSKIKSFIFDNWSIHIEPNNKFKKYGYDVYYLTLDLLDENSILKYGINLSRIDTCIIEFEDNQSKNVSIHAINTNIFRTKRNMGGIAFSN